MLIPILIIHKKISLSVTNKIKLYNNIIVQLFFCKMIIVHHSKVYVKLYVSAHTFQK